MGWWNHLSAWAYRIWGLVALAIGAGILATLNAICQQSGLLKVSVKG